MSKDKIKLPSMLAFERKLETSDALMYAGDWEDIGTDKTTETHTNKEGKTVKQEVDAWQPIPITKRQNRSTQSQYGASEEQKKTPNPASSNSDDANLPPDKDTLKVSFSLRLIGNLGTPFGCNDPQFETAIKSRVTDFKDDKGQNKGLQLLAYRYAYNIANGRFLWRNRVGAEEITIRVKLSDEPDQVLQFDAYDFSLKNFDKNKVNQDFNQDLQTLAEFIQAGLAGDENSFKMLEVDAFVKLGKKQHIFPSQEMNTGEKAKVLFQLNDCAAMHNVKIGNAIRTIDTWYDESNDTSPIAIEPFGSVTQRGEAHRPSKNDLYTLMVNWVNNEEATPDDQQAYIIACLIRGGVFWWKILGKK